MQIQNGTMEYIQSITTPTVSLQLAQRTYTFSDLSISLQLAQSDYSSTGLDNVCSDLYHIGSYRNNCFQIVGIESSLSPGKGSTFPVSETLDHQQNQLFPPFLTGLYSSFLWTLGVIPVRSLQSAAMYEDLYSRVMWIVSWLFFQHTLFVKPYGDSVFHWIKVFV
jgi:hypothetical protein